MTVPPWELANDPAYPIDYLIGVLAALNGLPAPRGDPDEDECAGGWWDYKDYQYPEEESTG